MIAVVLGDPHCSNIRPNHDTFTNTVITFTEPITRPTATAAHQDPSQPLPQLQIKKVYSEKLKIQGLQNESTYNGKEDTLKHQIDILKVNDEILKNFNVFNHGEKIKKSI